MAGRWTKVADEIEALRTAGANRVGAAAEIFAGPVIETTHRVVSPPAAAPTKVNQPVLAIAPPAAPAEEFRFRGNGRLINTGKGESFLAQGRKNKGWA